MNITLADCINILLKHIVDLIIHFNQKIMNFNYYQIYLSGKFKGGELKGSAKERKEKKEIILKVELVLLMPPESM